ncbi:hypothetical protein ACFPMF_03855 [Larkinella bovis]|uniref:Uncharacterized protein n=1 Tax=Larkinella bovis TaxID=683041 RepID=A0ABW0I731_9BACT
MLSICIVLLQKPSPAKLAVGVVLALLATFTHGNGILVFATGGFLLLLEKEYKLLAIWILFMLLGLGFYLSGYTPGSGVKSQINWLYLPATYAGKIGALISVWPSISIPGSILWGAIICLTVFPFLVLSVFNSFKPAATPARISHALLAYFCFIFLTVGLITIFRSASEIVLENRFKIYAAFSAVFFYLALISLFPRWRNLFLTGFTIFAGLVYINSYYIYTPEVANKHSRLTADTYNWPNQQTELCNTSSIASSLDFLLPAYREGYWQVPRTFGGFEHRLTTLVQQKAFRPAPSLSHRFLQDSGNLPQLVVEMEDGELRRQKLRDNLFIVLHDEDQKVTYLAGTLPKVAGWRQFLKTATYFGNGFSTTVPLQAVKAGTYRLGSLLTRADQSMELVMTDQTVSIATP